MWLMLSCRDHDTPNQRSAVASVKLWVSVCYPSFSGVSQFGLSQSLFMTFCLIHHVKFKFRLLVEEDLLGSQVFHICLDLAVAKERLTRLISPLNIRNWIRKSQAFFFLSFFLKKKKNQCFNLTAALDRFRLPLSTVPCIIHDYNQVFPVMFALLASVFEVCSSTTFQPRQR